jgi:hypothetical protein
MMASSSRWAILPLAGALLAVGVASVAFAMGVATGGSPVAPVAQVAQPTTSPDHATLGQGGVGPGNMRLSVVQGTVASKTDTTIVVTTAAGKTVTVDVSATTRYSVRSVSSATLANVAVGNAVAAQGTLNTDGSLNATLVQVATNGRPGFGGSGGRGFGGGFGGGRGQGGGAQSPSPVPSASASGSNI